MSIAERVEEFQDDWIAALRSGDYKQQSGGTLRNENGHCCLGVGLETLMARFPDILEHAGVSVWDGTPTNPAGLYACESGWGWSSGGASFLPDPLAKVLGVACEDGETIGACQLTLARKNDAGVSFPMIADVLERHFGRERARA